MMINFHINVMKVYDAVSVKIRHHQTVKEMGQLLTHSALICCMVSLESFLDPCIRIV